MKIDVEGFEYPVLKGCPKTLTNPILKAVIIELNGSGIRYGFQDNAIHGHLVEAGMSPYTYLPLERRLVPSESYNRVGNTIYIRDLQFVEDRVKNQRSIRILDTML